jgi:hypothetical protein
MLTAAALYLIAAAAPASPPAAPTAKELHAACTDLAARTANGAKAAAGDPCRDFLFDFMTRFRDDEQARRELYLSGAGPYSAPEGPCFQIEGFVSFGDMAGLVAAYGSDRPASLDSSAGLLVLEALAKAYPCTPRHDGAP